MMQTSEHIPKPTDDEIARVKAWLKVKNFLDAQETAEGILTSGDYPRIMGFMGEVVDERFSKRALMGMVSYYAKKAGIK